MATKKLLLTGICWCGCGEETKPGAFFLQGHDKTAESAVIEIEYGSVAEFLDKHGYGPNAKNPLAERKKHRAKKK
jgi:hypothetical protein